MLSEGAVGKPQGITMKTIDLPKSRSPLVWDSNHERVPADTVCEELQRRKGEFKLQSLQAPGSRRLG